MANCLSGIRERRRARPSPPFDATTLRACSSSKASEPTGTPTTTSPSRTATVTPMRQRRVLSAGVGAHPGGGSATVLASLITRPMLISSRLKKEITSTAAAVRSRTPGRRGPCRRTLRHRGSQIAGGFGQTGAQRHAKKRRAKSISLVNKLLRKHGPSFFRLQFVTNFGRRSTIALCDEWCKSARVASFYIKALQQSTRSNQCPTSRCILARKQKCSTPQGPLRRTVVPTD